MTPEIWLAIIGGIVTLTLPVILAWLKFIETNTAKTAKKVEETHELVNGHSTRMQEMYDLSLRQAEVLAATEKRLAELEAYSRGKSDAENNAPAIDP